MGLSVFYHSRPPSVPWNGPRLADVSYTEIETRNGNLHLAAMVFAPESPRAAVVMIHGSGDSRRDNIWYLTVATGLRDRGLAVILPDKRGSEGSQGDWRGASMPELATDTAAFVAEARARWPGLPVTLLGISQGGWIAPIAAGLDPKPDAVIGNSGAAVPAAEQLTHEEFNTLAREIGVPAPVARILAPVTAWTVRAWRQKRVWDAIGTFDPLDYWARVDQPALVIYGGADEFDNVPVARSVARLEGLGKANLMVRVYPGRGHGMEPVGTGDIGRDFIDEVAAFALAAGRAGDG